MLVTLAPPPSAPTSAPHSALLLATLVRYFYTSLLRRAERAGLGRRPAQTPHEYRARLREQLPDAADDIERLTDSSIRAAYAPRPTTRDDARQARRPWERLRRRLQNRARTRP